MTVRLNKKQAEGTLKAIAEAEQKAAAAESTAETAPVQEQASAATGEG